jgi:hypothetical protein
MEKLKSRPVNQSPESANIEKPREKVEQNIPKTHEDRRDILKKKLGLEGRELDNAMSELLAAESSFIAEMRKKVEDDSQSLNNNELFLLKGLRDTEIGENDSDRDILNKVGEVVENDVLADESKLNLYRMEKISEPLGSNDGGWFENPSTKEKMYVKFYENPDQARVEYVANAIYSKLGINAVDSQLTEMDGKVAIASPEVVGAKPTTSTEQQNSAEVRNGFVADAYLANWDVVGLVNDNIVRDSDGNMHRIDNGGTLTFRAMGTPKGEAFKTDSIPELTTMRNPSIAREAGTVFSDITQEQIQGQAQHLVDSLSVEDIHEIVDSSGLEGDEKNAVLAGLIGRREFLINEVLNKTENLIDTTEVLTDNIERRTNTPRFGEVLTSMMERSGENTGERLRPRGVVVCDHDHIEGQQINIVDARDVGRLEVSFKLREEAMANALTAARKRNADNLGVTKEKGIEFKVSKAIENEKVHDQIIDVPTLSYKFDDCVIELADVEANSYGSRAFLGAVRIHIDNPELPPAEIERQVANALNSLGVENGLGEVSSESEEHFKINSYLWHHKKEYGDTGEALRLERQEVFPGYFALVDVGKQKEYAKKYGDMVPVHEIGTQGVTEHGQELLASVLTSGILSSSERYRRGATYRGLSTEADFDSGGADSVFTRTTKNGEKFYNFGTPNIKLVLNPEIYERTDWYAYNSDIYGSTRKDDFKKRITPDRLFTSAVDDSLIDNNEQMFRTGIPPDAIDLVLVSSEEVRLVVIDSMKQRGIEEVGGKKIEDLIQYRENYLNDDLKSGYSNPPIIHEEPKDEISQHVKELKQIAGVDTLKADDFKDLNIGTINGILKHSQSTITVLNEIAKESENGKAIIQEQLRDAFLTPNAMNSQTIRTFLKKKQNGEKVTSGDYQWLEFMQTNLGINLEEELNNMESEIENAA